jgi:glycosyltransferase involved in cell wall biosynthesis
LRIAFLLPSLAKTTPAIIVANIIRHIKNVCGTVEVFYFDEEPGLDMGVPSRKLNFPVPLSFENFDILHTHMFQPGMYVKRHRNHIQCKTVATIHSLIERDVSNHYSFPKNYLIIHRWLNALRFQDALVCPTITMRKHYQPGYPGHKIYVVNHGIEPDAYHDQLSTNEVEELSQIKKDYKIIGTASVLTKQKGLEIIIPFLQQHKNYVWYAPGTGNFSNIFKLYAHRAGVLGRCFFVGCKKNITAFYPWYDIFACPSHSEGFGWHLAEAAMYKRPIICSNIEVFRELFTEEDMAFFTLDNVNSFNEAIKKLEQSPETFGNCAYAKLMQRYTAIVMAQNYLSVYKEILN